MFHDGARKDKREDEDGMRPMMNRNILIGLTP